MKVVIALLVLAALACFASCVPLTYPLDRNAFAPRPSVKRQDVPTSSKCQTVQCIEDGDTGCDSDFTDCVLDYGYLCERICPVPTVCRPEIEDRQSKRCVRSMWGRKCEEDSDCLGVGTDPDLECNMHTLRCAINHEYKGVANDFCNEEIDCVSGLLCVAGRCTAQPEGGSCDNDGDCHVGLYCNETSGNPGTCTARSADIECERDEECPNLHLCNGTSERCVALNSVPVDGDCFANTLCEDELFCDGGKCKAVNVSNEGQACDPTSVLANETCLVELSECTCNTNDGAFQCFAGVDNDAQYCYAEYSAYIDCLDANSCSTSSSFTEPEACAYEFCFTEGVNYVNCDREARYWNHLTDLSCWIQFSTESFDPSPASGLSSWLF